MWCPRFEAGMQDFKQTYDRWVGLMLTTVLRRPVISSQCSRNRSSKLTRGFPKWLVTAVVAVEAAMGEVAEGEVEAAVEEVIVVPTQHLWVAVDVGKQDESSILSSSDIRWRSISA